MRANWRKTTIGEVCDVVNGGTPKTGVSANWGGPHMWITPAEMGRRADPYVAETQRQLTNAGLAAANLLPPNSVILSSRAPIGHLVINTMPMATNQGCKGLVSKSGLYYKYLFYYLGSIVPLLNELGTGATFKELSGGKLKEVAIPLPPLAEQQRIVAILDEAFAGLANATANAEKNLKNARELFESSLNSIFETKGEGWRRVCIRDVCDSIVDCPNRTAPKIDSSSPYKMIRTTNVRNGRISLETVNYVTEETYRRWTRRQVPQRGDVLLTREAPLGEVGMICTDDYVFLGQRLVSYRADPTKLDNSFLLFALQSSDLQRQIRAFGSGATVQHMRVPDSKALMLSLPPLDMQQRVSAKLNELWEASDHLAANYRQKLEQLKRLKQSILEAAFSGKLTSHLAHNMPEAAE